MIPKNELNATCEICGNKYHVCEKCIKLRNNGMDNWRLHCDKAVCYQVRTVVNEYKEKHIEKSEAAEQLISVLNAVTPIESVQAIIDEIMTEDKQPVAKKNVK